MLRNRNSSFIYDEEFKSQPLKQSNNYLSANLTNGIELTVNKEQYYITKDNPLFNVLYPIIITLPMTTIETNATLCINLPLSIDKETLQLYFQLLDNSNTPLIELSTVHKLIKLCLFFNSKDILQQIIQSNIKPNINKNTSIEIIDLYFPYINHELYKESFSLIVNSAINIVSSNLFYVISNMRESFLQLPEQPFEEIITKYFQGVLPNVAIDHSLIMGVLMIKRDSNDIFDLLENERKKSIVKFERLLTEPILPSLEWAIQTEDPQNGLYIESNEFYIDLFNVQIICYYDPKKDVFNIALKIISIKEEEIDSLSQRYLSHDETLRISYPNQNTNNTTSTPYIISILSLCEIPELQFKSKINFNCIFSNSKTKVLISRIDNFNQKFIEKNIDFNPSTFFHLNIFFDISYNFSSVLNHICKNFYQYHSFSSVGIMPKNVLNIILRNEELNIQSEDEVLIAVLNWLNYRSNQAIDVLLDIGKNINWGLVTMEGLFDFLSSQGKILVNTPELQEIIANEINERFKEDNYMIEDNSFVESKVKLKRKYIATSRTSPTPKKQFALDLITNLLKLITKSSSLNSNNKSNSITAIFHNDDNRKISMMNHSALELGYSTGSAKNSIRNSMSNSHSKSKPKTKAKKYINKSKGWKKILSSNSNNDCFNPIYHHQSERLKERKTVNLTSNPKRNKIICSTYQLNPNISEYSNREHYLQSHYPRTHHLQQKYNQENRCPNTNGNTSSKANLHHQSLYPHYIKNLFDSKGKSVLNNTNHNNINYSTNSLSMHNKTNTKKKIPNLIKIAKRESKENSLNRRLKNQGKRGTSSLAKHHKQRKGSSQSKSLMD